MADPAAFDPIRLIKVLDRHRVSYVVIGALARVIHGADEVTDGLDIVPSTKPENLARLERALTEITAAHARLPTVRDPLVLETEVGDLKVITEPAASCTLAAAEKLRANFSPENNVVLILCGGNTGVPDLCGYIS